jgi:TatD DNase family protein
LETDAPDMIPQAYRQQAQKNNRNSPAFLPTVAESIAALKGVTINEVIEVTRYQSLNILRMQTDKEESA